MQKDANLGELEKCCQTHIYLQNFVLIQPGTSPPKICKNLLLPTPTPTADRSRLGRRKLDRVLRGLHSFVFLFATKGTESFAREQRRIILCGLQKKRNKKVGREICSFPLLVFVEIEHLKRPKLLGRRMDNRTFAKATFSFFHVMETLYFSRLQNEI